MTASSRDSHKGLDDASAPHSVAFLAWSSVSGRPTDIARVLNGDARCYYPLRIRRRSLLPVRYALSAAQMIGYLARHRPRAVIVTNPPIFAPLLAYGYARLTDARLLLDSHPDAFREDGPHSRFLRLHAWLVRRARATMVTSDVLGSRVQGWGGSPVVVHEPPPDWSIGPAASLPTRPTVLVLGTLATDEPVAETLAAARDLPQVDFAFTGDIRRCPEGLLRSATSNVRFLGFLGPEQYRDALEQASVTVVLTTWLQWAVPRSAYDAVYARRPLVVSDSPTLRELFPEAVKVDNDPASIGAGIRDALSRHAELAQAASEALERQERRWDDQLTRLRELITTPSR